MTTYQIKIDPELKALIPPLSEDELRQLEANLVEHGGARDPLVIWPREAHAVLLDGHNRYEICTRLGLQYQTKELAFADGVDAKVWMIENQLGRRNLTDDQRAAEALHLQEFLNQQSRRDRAQKGRAAGGKATQNQLQDRLAADVSAKRSKQKKKRETRKLVSKKAKISEHKIRQAKAVKDASNELFTKVQNGEMTLAEAVREIKRKAVVQRLESVEAKTAKELAGEYDVLVIDPPWPMEKIERDARERQVAFEYPTMQESELTQLRLPMAESCHAWLWTTQKFLPMSLRLLDAWGLKYVCTFVWHKPGGFQPFGLPQYNCEFAIYARKGAPQFIDTKAFFTCFDAPRGKHSEKPEEFYDVVRRVTAGRRIDIFNRRKIEGFDTWGKEAAE